MINKNKYKLSEILPALENVKGRAGKYTALCPAHADNKNSFSIVADPDGYAICNCFAGCSQTDIFNAIKTKIGSPESSAKNSTIKRTKKVPAVAEYLYINEKGAVIDIKRRCVNKRFYWEKGTAKRAEILPLYHLADIIAARVIYCVEGEKDADTLQRLGYAATSTKDGFTAENMKYLTGKQLIIIADNDAKGAEIAKAAAEIASAPAASVKVLNIADFFKELPAKGDITDYVEAGGKMEALEAYIKTLPDYTPAAPAEGVKKHPHADIYENIEHYSINKKGQLIYSNGDSITLVCFGSLAIKEEIRKNNGESSALYFKIEGVTEAGRVLSPVIVKASELASFNWLADAYGSAIITAPTNSAKQKLYAGLLMTGRQAIQKTIYTATGYLFKNKKPVAYIHAGGNLEGSETLEADINANLKQYTLAGKSSSSSEQKAAALASLELLRAHAPGVVFPLFAFVYLAPLLPIINDTLKNAGFCLYLQGKTQSGKSTLAALALSHFGSFDAMTPPTSFNSTANYINEISFLLKDSILWIDDFHPQGTKKEADKQAQIFQNIARAAGDHSQRGRLTSAAKLQAIHPPRCLFLATGEDAPGIGQSGLARLFTLQVKRQRENITELRKSARAGLLSRAMSDYISFIINNYNDVQKLFIDLYGKAAEAAINDFSENRLSNQSALLFTASEMFLSYLVINNIMPEADASALKNKFYKYIFGAADNIANELFNSDPVQMYLKALRAIIASGRRYIINLEAEKDAGLYQNQSLGASGDVIGWRDSYFYYLEPNSSFGAVVDYYKAEGVYFNISPKTLNRELYENDYISGSGAKDPTTLKRIEGKVNRVLKFPRAVLEETEENENK